MSSYLLLHGACHGGWVWQPIAERLRARGHRVYHPSLLGMAESADLLTAELTLDDHVEQLERLLCEEDLNQVTLVGHSYAGLVIGALHARQTRRIQSLIFLDAFIPKPKQTGLQVTPTRLAEWWQSTADRVGDGWCNPVNERTLEFLGIDDAEVGADLLPRLTDFSINFLRTPVELSPEFERVEKRYIHCTKPSVSQQLMRTFWQQAQAAGWPTVCLATDHDPMWTAPDELFPHLLD